MPHAYPDPYRVATPIIEPAVLSTPTVPIPEQDSTDVATNPADGA